MESEWRWNVADQGFAAWQLDLLARLLTPIPGLGHWIGHIEGTGQVYVGDPIFLSTGEQGFGGVVASLVGNFPGQFRVFPD